MLKLYLFAMLYCCFIAAHSQQFIAFKKRSKTLETYWKGSTIAFRLKDKQWQKGEIIKIKNDSFYIQPVIINYYFGRVDTMRLNISGYTLSDVCQMPKPGVLIDYKNGSFQISRTGGHQHFYWIKSGYIFRVGALGYAALRVANELADDGLSVKQDALPLSIAAGVLLGGAILDRVYKLEYRINKKYHFESVDLTPKSKPLYNN